MKINCFLFAIFIYFIPSLILFSEVHQQSENLFHTEIFQSYRQQFDRDIAPLYPHPFLADPENPRDFYQKFLFTLREGTAPIKAYEWFFLGLDLNKEQLDDAKRRLGIDLYSKGYSHPETVAQFIQKHYKETLENPEFDGYIKDKILDPFLVGNFPYILYRHPIGEKEVQFIRMPAPAHSICFKKDLKHKDEVLINEEFVCFLNLQAQKKQKHLYVSFLNDWKNGENRCFTEKLADLEMHPDWGDNFYYVMLDKDSSFYYQNNEFSKQEDGVVFFKSFLDRLFSGKDGYRWPRHLNQNVWKKECTLLVKNLYEQLYKGKKNLTIEERQAFIEICYSRIIRALISQIQPDTCNLTCHYTIDRAASTTAIFFFDLLYEADRGIPNTDVLKLTALLVNQPILLQNRVAHDYRINRVTQVLLKLPQLTRLN